MAIAPKAPGSTYAGPMPDSRAASYITYYTKSGWDRWKMASEQVAQAVAENKLTYQTAAEQYKLQLKDISAEKANLQKKISDIATLRAKAEVGANAARWKSQDAERFATYKAETSKAEKEAQIPSWSYSHGWSRQMGTGLGAAVRTAGGRDAGDEAADEVAGTPHESIGKAVASTADVDTAVASLEAQHGRINSGGEDNTQYGAGVVQSLTFRQQASKLAALSGGALTELQAAAEIKAALAKRANGSVILGNIDFGNKAIEARAAGVGSRESESESKSGGATYGTITLPAMDPISTSPVNLEAFDKAEKELSDKLTKVTGLSPSVPVLEPIDLITTARRTYAEKFGDTPRGVSLALGGGVTGFYKNLAPFEITEGLKKTQKFFEMYIQDEITKGRAAKTDFTVDDLNAATELGKAKARTVLFGGISSYDKAKDPRNPANAPLERTLGTAEALIRSTLSKEDREDPRRAGYATTDAAKEVGVPLSDLERARQADEQKEADMLRTPFSGDSGADFQFGSAADQMTVEPADFEFGSSVDEITVEPAARRARAPAKPRVKTEAEKRAEDLALLNAPADFEFGSAVGKGLTVEPATKFGPVPPPARTGPATPPPIPQGMTGADAVMRGTYVPTPPAASGPANMTGPFTPPPMPPGMTPADAVMRGTYVPTLPPVAPPKNQTDRNFLGPAGQPVISNPDNVPPVVVPGLKPTPAPTVPVDKLGQVDKKAKSEAVVAATKRYIEEPRAAARDITKDSMGKYVSSLYDTNKEKGAGAASVGQLSSTLIREYSGDPKKQTKALELLTQLALLDSGSTRIRPLAQFSTGVSPRHQGVSYRRPTQFLLCGVLA